MIILRIIKAIRNTCIIIASPLIGPPLPVIGFQVLVITHISTKTVVPTIPIEYQVLPPCLIIWITQHVWAIPPIKNKMPALTLPSIVFETLTRCNIPAIKVVAAATYSNIVTFLPSCC